MPTAKPASETLVDGSNPIAPTYGAWILRGVNPEKDSLNLGVVSAPVSGTGLTVGTNPNGDPAWDFAGAGGLYPIANLPAPVASAGTKQTVIARVYVRTYTGFRVIYANSSSGFFISAGHIVIYPQTASPTTIPLNTWLTVGVTVDISNNTKYYINGALDSTIASGTVGIPSNSVVGIGRDGAGEYFDGLIDYVFVWDDFAMTAADHLSIHNDPFQVFAGAGPTALNVAVYDASTIVTAVSAAFASADRFVRSDAIAVAEFVAKRLPTTKRVTATEVLTVVESVRARFGLAKRLSDSITVTENVKAQKGVKVSDHINVNDAVTALLRETRLGDSIRVFDSVTVALRIAHLRRLVSDAITVTEYRRRAVTSRKLRVSVGENISVREQRLIGNAPVLWNGSGTEPGWAVIAADYWLVGV